MRVDYAVERGTKAQAEASSFFDGLANCYDETWTHTRIGQMQRNAVWREIDPLILPNDRALDLGCGTGEDALHLAQAGATVVAIDGSSRMVEVALGKGINARLLRIEQIGELAGTFEIVLSNFGALNCLPDLATLREPLARLIRPGGRLAICIMNRFCLWESVYFALNGRFAKASRRWQGEAETSAGLRVFYPSLRTIRRALAPSFRLVRDIGVGVCVPPSFVRAPSPRLLDCLEKLDARLAGSKIGRAVGDHRLLIFAR